MKRFDLKTKMFISLGLLIGTQSGIGGDEKLPTPPVCSSTFTQPDLTERLLKHGSSEVSSDSADFARLLNQPVAERKAPSEASLLEEILASVEHELASKPKPAKKLAARPPLSLGNSAPKAYSAALSSVQMNPRHVLEAIDQEIAQARLDMERLAHQTFPELLHWLAERYDKAVDPIHKASMIHELMIRFRVINEDHYMNLIAHGPHSREFKKALSARLAQRFQNDPTWVGPLDRARRQAGLI